MNFLAQSGVTNLLAQVNQPIDFRNLAEMILLVIGCIVVVGIVIQVTGVKQYLSWVPMWFWQILGVVLLIGFALWAIRNFF